MLLHCSCPIAHAAVRVPFFALMLYEHKGVICSRASLDHSWN